MEEVLLELLEAPGPEQGVVRGREAAARHRRDDVDIPEGGPGGAAGRRVRHGLERFQQPVGERGGSRATAGEGEDHEQLLLLPAASHGRRAESAVAVGRQTRVDRPGASGERDERDGGGKPSARLHQILLKSTRKGLRTGRPGPSSLCVGGSTSARPPRRKTWDPALTYSARGLPLAARLLPCN